MIVAIKMKIRSPNCFISYFRRLVLTCLVLSCLVFCLVLSSRQRYNLFVHISLPLSACPGGMDMVSQAMMLAKKPHILVATPGRLVDHFKNTKGFNLKSLKFLVMDEADRILNMDFEAEVRCRGDMKGGGYRIRCTFMHCLVLLLLMQLNLSLQCSAFGLLYYMCHICIILSFLT